MTANGWFQILFFLALIFLVTKPMGVFMTRVFNRERTFMDPVLRPIEKLLYRVTLVDENHEMRWTEYAISMLLFSLVSMVVLYLIERLQGFLPFNPQKLGAVAPAHLAFNTAASFTTNTNWQNYAGETTMSYFTQMAGLAYHNFTSAAVGIALAISAEPRARSIAVELGEVDQRRDRGGRGHPRVVHRLERVSARADHVRGRRLSRHDLSRPCRQLASRQRRRFQPVATGKRHRQLRQGRPTRAGQDRVRRPAGCAPVRRPLSLDVRG